ncbi:hypothetical protein D9M72_571470 [compost metagenome]
MACAVRVEVTTTGASCVVWLSGPLSAACANEVAGTRVNEAMAARMAGTDGRTAGIAGRVDLWSDERMMQDWIGTAGPVPPRTIWR